MGAPHPRRRASPFTVCFLAMVAAVVGAFVGTTSASFAKVFSGAIRRRTMGRQIFSSPGCRAQSQRRSSAAAWRPGSCSGLLRNPLATPYTLGVSAGASLGAMVAITFGAAMPVAGVASASLTGAALAVGVVYALASARRSGFSTTVLLLAGVTLNAFFSALILFVQYLSNFSDVYRAMRWLMGDLDVASYSPILAALPFIAVAFVAFAWLAKPLNLLSLGVDAAESRGVDVERAQRIAFFGASLATGAAVSIGGPIGFIGIIVPHLVRLLVGADHRVVLPASTFLGAAFLVICDIIARTAIAPMECRSASSRGAAWRAVLSLAVDEEAMKSVSPHGAGREAARPGRTNVLVALVAAGLLCWNSPARRLACSPPRRLQPFALPLPHRIIFL
jgi:iron complex transport system permease protein